MYDSKFARRKLFVQIKVGMSLSDDLVKHLLVSPVDFVLSLDFTSDWSFIVISLNCEEAKRSSFFYDGESNDI